MGRNIEDIIKALPKDRQVRIEADAQRMALEMIQHADSLEQLRKAAGRTQTEVAQKLGIKQNAVSQLESRADLYLSTLNKYVGALGHRLELALVTATGERVELPNFHPWEQLDPGAASTSRGAKRRASSARSKVSNKNPKPRTLRQRGTAIAAGGAGPSGPAKTAGRAARKQPNSATR